MPSRRVRQPAPTRETRPPRWLDSGRELRALWETLRGLGATALERRRESSARPVLVVPGFGANDVATWVLRERLGNAGFVAYPWALGINRGPRKDIVRRLARRMREIARAHGVPVQVVGWSMGGLLARVAAERARESVARVITLGTPLRDETRATRLGPLVEWACGRKAGDRSVRSMLARSRRVPVTSIYSRSDGVVAWRASAKGEGIRQAIEVDSSHCGMVVNPDVVRVVLSELLPRAAPTAPLARAA